MHLIKHFLDVDYVIVNGDPVAKEMCLVAMVTI